MALYPLHPPGSTRLKRQPPEEKNGAGRLGFGRGSLPATQRREDIINPPPWTAPSETKPSPTIRSSKDRAKDEESQRNERARAAGVPGNQSASPGLQASPSPSPSPPRRARRRQRRGTPQRRPSFLALHGRVNPPGCPGVSFKTSLPSSEAPQADRGPFKMVTGRSRSLLFPPPSGGALRSVKSIHRE